MKPRSYLILLLLPCLVPLGYYLGDWWNFITPLCCFAAYPVANLFFTSSEKQAHDKDIYSSSKNNKAIFLFVPVLILLTAWSIYIAGTKTNNIVSFTGLALSVGLINGIIGFTLAHEFIHRFKKFELFAGYLLLLQNNYMHYGIEHVYGHHIYACTPKDPHTAREGESLYAFLPRAIAGTFVNAWKIETRRLSRRISKNKLIHNRIIYFLALQFCLMLCVFLMLNLSALLFFIIQNAVSILLLHVINYLQHYGLIRQKNSTGSYEKMNEHHAWRTGRKNTSLNLFQLENHADHHMHPHKSFEKLERKENSPEHPAGYSFMVLLALVPPLWFRMMNKRIPSPVSNTSL